MQEIILASVIAYLIGSVSPGYFFGRLVKRIDIRKFGNKNTGATNVARNVGLFFGLLTAFIDVGKGAAAFFVAKIFLVSPDIALLTALFSIIGHNYPFYLGFRGGKGVAISLGIFLAAIFFTRSLTAFLVFLSFLIYAILVSERLKIVKPIRKMLRIGAIILPLSYFFFGQDLAFKISISLLAIFLFFDLARLLSKKANLFVFKKAGEILFKSKEKKFLSAITLFLISASIVIYFFPLNIAVIALVFALVGDATAETVGRVYRKLVFGIKSLEGSASGFAICLAIGAFLMEPLGVDFIFILKAALFTSLIEFSSQKIDDNLTVPLGTAVLTKIFT